METALYILHVIVCVGMLPIILLQAGKGGGVAAAFGGGGGSTFGTRGASNFLTTATSVCAVIFMCTSMGLSWFSSRNRSVISDVPEAPPVTAPVDQVVAPTSTTTP